MNRKADGTTGSIRFYMLFWVLSLRINGAAFDQHVENGIFY